MTKQHSSFNIQDRRILTGISIAIFGLFSLLIIQFFKLQIIQGEHWSKIAQGQHEFTVTEPFRRGTFISNSSVKVGHPETIQPFVIDVPKFHLHIDPLSIPETHRDKISKKLSLFLNIPSSEKEAFHENFLRKNRDRKLAMWLDRETKDAIKRWWSPYARRNKIASNALFFISDYRRSYPFGKSLGQVLHTIREEKDTITKQGIPTGGLELYFNDLLKGQEGKKRLLRSPRHSLETGNVILLPENGADIYLTVNHYLQAIAEEEIKKGVIQSKAKGGWAIMMDPKSGEMLALAQYPFFFTANYQNYYNDPSLIEHTKIKALTDSYEPASTMKPITLALCLKANRELQEKKQSSLFNPEEIIPTHNGHFPGRSKPLVDGRVHSFLNMPMALQKSSNIYMGKIIQRLIDTFGTQWYRNALQENFGFGKTTNIELPAESIGNLPTPGKKHPNGALEWSLSTPYSLAIGHNIQVNSIQMLRAFATLANGGYLVNPTLIRKIVKTHADETKEILLDNTSPKRCKSFPRVLDRQTIDCVVNAMKYVSKWGGTAPKANINGYTEAGKTGTAKKIIGGTYSNKHYFSTFIGFTPVNNPRIILLIAIDEPEPLFIPGIGKNHHGGQCAAPVFSEISRRSLEYLGVTPDDPHGYPHGDPRYDPEKADWIAETRELKKTYDLWNKHK